MSFGALDLRRCWGSSKKESAGEPARQLVGLKLGPNQLGMLPADVAQRIAQRYATTFSRSADQSSSTETMATPSIPTEGAYAAMLSRLMSVLIFDVPL